jgi:hypothetical protein
MYQALIGEIAKNKEIFKSSFDEINKKMSPSELLKNSESFGISGDEAEIADMLKEAYSEGIIKNKEDGMRREGEVLNELKEKYPEEDGYKVEQEVCLRDKDGNIVKDPITGEARRIDFVVTKDGKVVESIEVTSKTADKTGQIAKEDRIRECGGNYIKDSNGNLVEISSDVKTQIERRD